MTRSTSSKPLVTGLTGRRRSRPLVVPLALALVAMLLTNPLALKSQVVPALPDSAQIAQGRALCGPLADDSIGLSLLSLSAGALVSANFPGLEGPTQLGFWPIPEYPGHLRRRGIQGTVVVTAIIDTTGRVERGSIKVVTTPHDDFVPAVERYLLGARFEPGRLYSRLMRVCVVMPIAFSLPRR